MQDEFLIIKKGLRLKKWKNVAAHHIYDFNPKFLEFEVASKKELVEVNKTDLKRAKEFVSLPLTYPVLFDTAQELAEHFLSRYDEDSIKTNAKHIAALVRDNKRLTASVKRARALLAVNNTGQGTDAPPSTTTDH